MNTFSLEYDSDNNPFKREIGIIISVLESGNSVELQATGYSMFPTLRPGDRVVVKPISKDQLPKPGNVVVCIENGLKAQTTSANASVVKGRNGVTEERHNGSTAQWRNGATEEGYNNITTEQHNITLVMHRLVKMVNNDAGIQTFITRGDSSLEPDQLWPQKQLLGVAVSYKRSGKEHLIINFLPGAWRYKYNRRLLRMFGKIKRLSMGPGKLLKSKQ
jgi:signal peptidase I